MKLNPSAVVVWIFVGLIAFLLSGSLQTTMWAVAIMMGISILLSFF